MFKKIIIILILFIVPNSFAYKSMLDDIKKETASSIEKKDFKKNENAIDVPDNKKYIEASENVLEKRCREHDLSEVDCKREIRKYETNNYLKNRYLNNDLDSQKHFE